MRKSIFVFSLIVFFGIIFFGGSNKVYAQFTCDPNTSPQISTCGGPPDTTYQTAPLCSFAYYPYGTFAVYKEVYACTGHQTTCYSNLTGQAVSQSSCTVDCVPAPSSYETCSGVATCGNNKKDTNECCDPTAPGSSPSTCDSSCACIGGAPSCGDGVCNGYEDANNCSQDCSGGTPTSLCPSNPIITNVYGATDKVLYQGDSVNLFYSIESNNTDNQSYNVSSIGCPPGATCSGSGGMVGGGDPPDIRSYTISNTGSTPTRSDNPISLKVSSASDPTCSYDLVYNLNIKPSRKSVCDGAWHEVPPYPYPYAVYSGPFARFDGTNMKATVNADYIAMTSPLTWQRANFSLLCRYLGGSGDTCTWDQPTQMPNTGYPYGAATYGWQMLGAPYGSTASATDGGGRTYTLQRSGNFVQYKCDVPVVQYALTVSKNGTGSGTVTSAPAGISCGSGSGCSASYANGTSVSLSASAASGSVFTGWGGACSGSGACNVSMSQARSVTATFNTAATCDAFMSPASNAVVSNVTSSGYRITWTPQNGSYDNNTRLRIASNLNQTGATQVGTYKGTWTYGSCPNPPLVGASQCIVFTSVPGTISTYNVTGAQPNTTYYNRLPTLCPDQSAYEDYVFTAVTAPVAVTPIDVAIVASPSSMTLPNNSTILSWATSGNPTSCTASNYWSGAKNPAGGSEQRTGMVQGTYNFIITCSKAGTPDATDSVDVVVSPVNQFSLTVSKSGTGSGTITSAPAGISCGADCAESYASGTSVTLSQAATAGSTFAGWSGACSGVGACTVSMTQARAVTATFNTVAVGSCPAGTVALGSTPINQGQTTTATAPLGFGKGSFVSGNTAVATIPSPLTNPSTVNGVSGGTSSISGTGWSYDNVWIEDSVPAGASVFSDGGDSWSWVASNPTPYSGNSVHKSNVNGSEHQHYFTGANPTFAVNTGDVLVAYVFLNPSNPPSEVMLQWNERGSWDHRAYWGANSINWGTNGTNSRRYMGSLPPTGQWIRLEVPASQIGLEGTALNGMAFTLYGGQASWDHIGKNAGINNCNLTGRTLTVGGIIPATANISANPTTIPYNTASTLTWSYSNATSCNITPPPSPITVYPSGSGSISTGNLTAPRTYTIDCNPIGPNSSASATVTVQAQSTFNLTVIRSGQGTVSSNPAGISCGTTCGHSYPADTLVNLTATPATGRIFVGWGGACSGRGACSVLVNGNKTVFANFAIDPNFKEF